MVKQLVALLNEVRNRASDFSGLGLIVSDHPELLPIAPLRRNAVTANRDTLISKLVEISANASEHHDGFHVISRTGVLVRAAQYFSPPILEGAALDHDARLGGRYAAALFGSAIPAIDATAILSEHYGISVFVGGHPVFREIDE